MTRKADVAHVRLQNLPAHGDRNPSGRRRQRDIADPLLLEPTCQFSLKKLRVWEDVPGELADLFILQRLQVLDLLIALALGVGAFLQNFQASRIVGLFEGLHLLREGDGRGLELRIRHIGGCDHRDRWSLRSLGVNLRRGRNGRYLFGCRGGRLCAGLRLFRDRCGPGLRCRSQWRRFRPGNWSGGRFRQGPELWRTCEMHLPPHPGRSDHETDDDRQQRARVHIHNSHCKRHRRRLAAAVHRNYMRSGATK